MVVTKLCQQRDKKCNFWNSSDFTEGHCWKFCHKLFVIVSNLSWFYFSTPTRSGENTLRSWSCLPGGNTAGRRPASEFRKRISRSWRTWRPAPGLPGTMCSTSSSSAACWRWWTWSCSRPRTSWVRRMRSTWFWPCWRWPGRAPSSGCSPRCWSSSSRWAMQCRPLIGPKYKIN